MLGQQTLLALEVQGAYAERPKSKNSEMDRWQLSKKNIQWQQKELLRGQ